MGQKGLPPVARNPCHPYAPQHLLSPIDNLSTTTRFLTDSSLDYLARRLRFLGFDVVTLPGARLEELLERARQEGRTVLTSSARHPRRFAEVPVISVPRMDTAGAVRALAGSHQPASPPFGRCPGCNDTLQTRHPFEARGEVPASVLRSASPLTYCPSCGKWYWSGSHVARIREWLERVIGRPLPG